MAEDKKDESKAAATAKEDAKPAPPKPLLQELKHHLVLLNRAVSLLEPRFTTRVLKSLPSTRKKLTPSALAEVLNAVYPPGSQAKDILLEYLGNPAASSEKAMEVDSGSSLSAAKAIVVDLADKVTARASGAATPTPGGGGEELTKLPEADIYLSLLVAIHLIDSGKHARAKELCENLIHRIAALNRRSMDQLASKAYFYLVRSYELAKIDTADLRPTLLTAHRTATLRRDEDLQATLLTLLLRNFISHNLYTEADLLASKSEFPESTAGNAQLARWNYYLGRIRAIQLSYTDAHAKLQQALRRAPPAEQAPGFAQTVMKLSIIVELLMGEIPERATFRQPVFKGALAPYLQIVQAVRIGDLTKFNEALSTYGATFTKDGNYTLILRLRHNVIKTALRTISLSYSRIPLRDVSAKLHLDSEEDAEFIVAKAIRDGVILASVDHGNGFMKSKETGDVYSTSEPQGVFDTRIKFLLELHNQSVKAMRYPVKMMEKELASADEARERERELAKEIEAAEEDADFDSEPDMDAF